MSNIPRRAHPPLRRSVCARYRKHRKQGLRSVRILLDQMDVDAFIEMRLLKIEK